MPRRISQPRRDRNLPPNYLSSSFQRQMLLLFVALVLVLILMKIAAQPSTWAWMWGGAGGQANPPATAESGWMPPPSAVPSSVDFESATATGSMAPGEERPDVGGIPTELQDALRESVKDDTFFRSAERQVWFQLWSWLRDAGDPQFAAPMDVSSLQLLQQMPAYRGRLVRVQGVVRQATRVNASVDNQAGISSYWQCWLQDAAGTAPIVVYSLQLPEGFPEGTDLREPAEFTGLAFKRWAYQAQSGLLVAPVVLAKTADWTPHPTLPEKPRAATRWLLITTLGVAILSLIVVRLVFAGSRRSRRTVLLVVLGTILAPSNDCLAASAPKADLAEILQLHKLDASQWRRFADGEPLADDEREPLYRVLYVLPRLETAEIPRRQQLPTIDAAELAERPDVARGQLFRVDGYVAAAQVVSLPPESARRFGYTQYYEVLLESTTDSYPRIVYARKIPPVWQNAVSIRDFQWPASCSGLFLKRGAGESGAETLLFVADRIAWHPQQAEPSAGVNEGMALLGSAGVDVGLLSEVVQKQPLVAQDRECFYEMLSAASRLVSRETPRDRAPNIAVDRLLQQPHKYAGQLLTISGTARRALRVEVADPDIRERFGIDHYFEVEVFRLLPQPLKLIDSRDGQAHVYRSFPITVCLPNLPPEIPQGAEIQQEVQLSGWFLKLWSYRSRFLEATPEQAGSVDPAEKRQISPLLVGISIDLVPPTPPGDPGIGWAVATGLLITLVTIALIAWWYQRGDRAFLRWRQSRVEPPSGLDLRIPDEPS